MKLCDVCKSDQGVVGQVAAIQAEGSGGDAYRFDGDLCEDCAEIAQKASPSLRDLIAQLSSKFKP